MKHYINTDIMPIYNGLEGRPRDRSNWPSPIADKLFDGMEHLSVLSNKGYYECYFDSQTQIFSVNMEKCNGLSEQEIIKITHDLNSIGKTR